MQLNNGLARYAENTRSLQFAVPQCWHRFAPRLGRDVTAAALVRRHRSPRGYSGCGRPLVCRRLRGTLRQESDVDQVSVRLHATASDIGGRRSLGRRRRLQQRRAGCLLTAAAGYGGRMLVVESGRGRAAAVGRRRRVTTRAPDNGGSQAAGAGRHGG